jgi:hypothetical protein
VPDTIDARIPLGYQFPQLPTAQSVEQAKQLQYRNELAQIDVQNAQEAQAQQNALKSIFAQPGAMDPQTGLPTPATVARVTQANPDAGLKLQNSLAELQTKKTEAMTNFLHQRMLGLQINGNQADKLTDIATQAQVRYDDLIKQGTPPTEAAKIVSDERNNAIDGAVKDGTLLPDQGRQLRLPFDPSVNRAFIAGSKQYKTVLDEQAKAKQAQLAQDREQRMASDADRRADAAEQDPFMKEAAAAYGKGTPEYNQAIKDHLAKQSTGAGQGPMGSREAVYVNRALSSAGLAVRDISNIARGPVSQSTGIFGGRGQGPSLMDATKEQLATAITPQEAQTYNVKIAGLQRNLATLESQGLAPSGSLTHQMDAIVFKEGDTNLTKAYKLAEARQIVEGAMDVITNNDRAPKGAKDLAGKILTQVQQSVPFTVEDLDKFSASGKKNAKIGDFLEKSPAGGQGKAPQAALDYLKAHPEAKAQFKAKYGYLP